ncbi:MAG TPA: PH domain-containing protein [Rhizomicrobium sp.]
MSYIDKSLGTGEAVITRARFHWLYTVYAWVQILLPLVLLGALYAEASAQPPVDSANPYFWGMVIVGVWLLAGAIGCARMLIRKSTTEIGVTSHRFVEKYGLVSMRTNEIALHNIEGVRVNQSVLGRIFGYGTVRIEGTGVDSVTTPTIADPVGFVRAIQTAREHPANA